MYSLLTLAIGFICYSIVIYKAWDSLGLFGKKVYFMLTIKLLFLVIIYILFFSHKVKINVESMAQKILF